MPLRDYQGVIASDGYDLGALVREAGVRCSRCGSGRCARRHALWRRKRVIDVSSGAVFENLPVVRVRFCDGSTISLPPAELWRGRATVSSVVETVSRVFADGLDSALRWTGTPCQGEEPFSERTLRRWRDQVQRRVLGGSLSWLGPRLDPQGSATVGIAPRLRLLLDRLDPAHLLRFRATFGRAVLDSARTPPPRPSSPARRVRGARTETPSPDPPSNLLPRGQRLGRAGRSAPARGDPPGGDR